MTRYHATTDLVHALRSMGHDNDAAQLEAARRAFMNTDAYDAPAYDRAVDRLNEARRVAKAKLNID